MRSLQNPLLVASGAMLALVPGRAAAQVPSTVVDGSSYALHGWSVDSAGDVDGDGFFDTIVGAPGLSFSKGKVHVHDSDGSLRFTLTGGSPLHGDLFGWSVSTADDVDGDGLDDVVVGDPGEWPVPSVKVFKGTTGALIWKTVDPDLLASGFARAVNDVGDLTGDGLAEILVGDPFWDRGGEIDVGAVYVLNGADGTVLHCIEGEYAFDCFGTAVAGVGDVSQDGIQDLAVGAPGFDAGRAGAGVPDAGKAYVISGKDFSVHFSTEGDGAGFRLGTSVSGRSMDGDLSVELILGQPGDDVFGPDTGSVKVFEVSSNPGAGGQHLYTRYGDNLQDSFGWSVSRTRDLNCDGLSDFVVGAPNVPGGTGYVRGFAGVDGSTLFTVHDSTVDTWFGYSVSETGDVDHQFGAPGNWWDDVLVGAPHAGYNGSSSGRSTVYLGSSTCKNLFGLWELGELGAPAIQVVSDPVLGSSHAVTLQSSSSTVQFGWLVLGFEPADLPTAWGGHLNVRPLLLVPLRIDPAGAILGTQVPDDPALLGFSLFEQLIMTDPRARYGLAFSQGLELVFGSY